MWDAPSMRLISRRLPDLQERIQPHRPCMAKSEHHRPRHNISGEQRRQATWAAIIPDGEGWTAPADDGDEFQELLEELKRHAAASGGEAKDGAELACKDLASAQPEAAAARKQGELSCLVGKLEKAALRQPRARQLAY